VRYDRRDLGEQAKKSGFVRDTFEKMVRLTDVLRFIHSEESLRGFLALKGGTAINLTLFDLPRLSVDIDLDMTRNLSIGAVDFERERIAGMLTRYMLANGYKESGKSRRHRILDSLVFVYENAAGHRDSIKLEMNYGLRTHILPVETRRIELPGELGTTDVVTVAPLEIFGSKIVALLTRAAKRDVYDIDSMIRSDFFRKDEFEMLRKCALFYYAITAESVQETLSDTSEMDLLTRASVRTDLRPVLRARERFDFRTERGERAYSPLSVRIHVAYGKRERLCRGIPKRRVSARTPVFRPRDSEKSSKSSDGAMENKKYEKLIPRFFITLGESRTGCPFVGKRTGQYNTALQYERLPAG